jgi:hypothetical protein
LVCDNHEERFGPIYIEFVERTPFKMFDENDAEAIEKGVLVEDLPKTRKYVQEINRVLAKVLNAYLIKTCICIARLLKYYKKNSKNKKIANWN